MSTILPIALFTMAGLLVGATLSVRKQGAPPIAVAVTATLPESWPRVVCT